MRRELHQWLANVPHELKPSSEDAKQKGPELLDLQALALQLAYDNIQIVVHRQAVFGSREGATSLPEEAAAIEQLIESGLRTARALEEPAIQPVCRSSHAAMHVGICAFTAGVVLSALHLASITHSRSSELVTGLQRIVVFFEHFPGQHYQLVRQSLAILRPLHSKCVHPADSEDSGQGLSPDTARNGKIADYIHVHGSPLLTKIARAG